VARSIAVAAITVAANVMGTGGALWATSVTPAAQKALPFEAVPYQSIRYFDPSPLRLRLDHVLQTDSIKLRRLFRILSLAFGESAGRQRIRPT